MIDTEKGLLDTLDEQQIAYQRVEHPAVFTCEEAARYHPELEGLSIKNLFLRDREGNHYLLVTDCTRRVDLKAVAARLGCGKLQFGSEEELLARLGVGRGAVTVLGLVNDRAGKVRLLFDADAWESEAFLCHPLVNTATLVIQKADLLRFFELSGHTVEFF